jgi:hypothetical protein
MTRLSRRSAFAAFVVTTRTSLSHARRDLPARINYAGAAQIVDCRHTRHIRWLSCRLCGLVAAWECRAVSAQAEHSQGDQGVW